MMVQLRHFTYLYRHPDSREVQRDPHALRRKPRLKLCRDCCRFPNQHPCRKMERVVLDWMHILQRSGHLLYIDQKLSSENIFNNLF